MHEGIALHLNAVEGLTYSDIAGGNIFIDRLPQGPDRAIAVYSAAGPEADSKLPYDPVDFQVVIRSEQGGLWAHEVWKDIYSALHGLRNTTLPDGTYLVYCLATSSSPFPLGEDENGRPQFSIDFRSEVLNTTSERP